MKTITIKCPYCFGDGIVEFAADQFNPCPVCKGEKTNEVPENNYECPNCKGTGRIDDGKASRRCILCKGVGVVPDRTVSDDGAIFGGSISTGVVIRGAVSDKVISGRVVSEHLDKIFHKDNGRAYCSIIFLDIVKYSKRKLISQYTVINQFNSFINETFTLLDKELGETLIKSKINLETDSIKLPIGDGIAIGFTFPGTDTIHVRFAEVLMHLVTKHSELESCIPFKANEYCDSHSHLKIRVGLGRGECIVYKDVNSNYNIAGNEVNLAARVQSIAGPNQIVFTEDAYKSYVNVTLGNVEESFKRYSNVEIKNGGCINVYHYTRGLDDENELNVKNCTNGDLANPAENAIITKQETEILNLSDDALRLLKAVSKDSAKQILRIALMGGIIICSNGITFNEASDARGRAKWEDAIKELEKAGFIEPKISGSNNGFSMTTLGFEFADSLVED